MQMIKEIEVTAVLLMNAVADISIIMNVLIQLIFNAEICLQ